MQMKVTTTSKQVIGPAEMGSLENQSGVNIFYGYEGEEDFTLEDGARFETPAGMTTRKGLFVKVASGEADLIYSTY